MIRSELTFYISGILTFIILIIKLNDGGKSSKESDLLTQALFFFIYSFIFTVYISLRPSYAGNDTQSYIGAFSAIYNIKDAFQTGFEFHGSADPLFWPAMGILKTIGITPEYLILTIGSISCILVYISTLIQTKSLNLPAWQASLFVVLILYTYQLVYLGNLLRVSIAYPICALSIIYAQKSTIKATTLCIMAIGFHISSIIAIPYILLYYFNKNFKINKQSIIYLTILSAFISLFNEKILMFFSSIYFSAISDKISLYQMHEFNLSSIFTTITFWFIFIHFIILFKYGNQKSTFSFFYIFFVILILSPIPKMAERYFPLILMFMPCLFFISLREKYSERQTLLFMSFFYIPIGFILINTESLRYTLWI